MHTNRRAALRFILTAVLAVLSLATLGGGAAGVAQAGVPANGAAASDPTAGQVLVLQVYFRSLAERDQLAADFGAEEVPTTGGYLTIIGDTDTLNSLLARGLRVEIDEKNTAIFNDPLMWDTFYGGYKTVEEIYQFLDQKVAQYPMLAEKVDIGDSWCKSHPGLCIHPQPNNGYDLFVMHITNSAIPGPKPVTWIDSGIHSREIATPEVAMRFIDWLLNGYDTNPEARWLVDNHDIWIMPTFNPDGHHIVEAGGGGSSPYMYRKNGNNTAGTCSWPPTSSNHYGVDDNRNFPFKWGCCGGSTSSPCAQTYRGVAQNSEDETQAVTAKIRTLVPDQRGPNDGDLAPITTTGVYQNIHTVVPVNLIPWGWTYGLAPNHSELNNIAAHSAALNAYPSGNNYPYGTISNQLYIVDGGSIDWAYGELGIAGISTELGGDDFLPAFTCIDNPGCGSPYGIWPENKGMLTYLSKIAYRPYLFTRGPDAHTVATDVMTVTQGTQVQLSAALNYVWSGNAFVQNIGGAEYSIDRAPYSGGTTTPMQPADGTFNSPTEGATATIDTTNIAPGLHTILVRGRGANDYQSQQTWGPISSVFLYVLPGAITPTPTSTPEPCTVSFSDVPPTDPFYANIMCLACRGILGGYSDGTFRPYNNITRGQIAKVVSNAAGLSDPVSGQTYADVDPSNPFYEWIERLTTLGVMSGYPCGSVGEPCDPQNRPYFRWGANATRGQLSKIVANAAGFSEPVSGQTFTDVPPTNPFYAEIERLASRGIMGGYPCGGAGEPCDPQNRPYFRWAANVTRGQASKIVANTFFPACVTR